MPAAGFLPLPGGKEWREARQPLLAAMQQIPRGERVGELLEVDALLTHAVGQPMMLIEADAGGERQVGTDADKHPSPLPVVDIEVVLDDPAVGDLKVPSVRLAVADRRHDARWLTRFENDHDGIEVCAFEIWIDEVVAAAFRGVGNRYVALLRPPFQPALKLVGNVPQHVPAHRVKLPVGVEKANHAFRLLERLNHSRLTSTAKGGERCGAGLSKADDATTSGGNGSSFRQDFRISTPAPIFQNLPEGPTA